jgi:metal-sulfur cluster biosynthetic enzyme
MKKKKNNTNNAAKITVLRREKPVTVSISKSFQREARMTTYASFQETEQEVFNNLSLTTHEKCQLNQRIVEHLERKIYQFVVLHYICSRTHSAIRIDDASDLSRNFVKIEHKEAVIIDKTGLGACLLHCKDSNDVLASFTRLRGHLTFLGQEYYFTKCYTQAVYSKTKQPPTTPPNNNNNTLDSAWPWFQSVADDDTEPEDIVELCMVYNITEAFVERVLTKFRTLLANKQTMESSSSSGSSPSLPSPQQQQLKPGQIPPSNVSVTYSPPPARVNPSSSTSQSLLLVEDVSLDDASSDSGSESDSIIGDVDLTFMIGGGKEATDDDDEKK